MEGRGTVQKADRKDMALSTSLDDSSTVSKTESAPLGWLTDSSLAVPAAALFDIIVRPPPLELSPLLTPLLYGSQTCGCILTLPTFEYSFPPAHRFPH